MAEWFREARTRLIALDVQIDTETPAGMMMLHLLAVIAEWERATIAQRTRDGLAARRARGKPISRPAVADHPELAARIREMRELPMSLQAIADALTADGVPTLRGAPRWTKSSVRGAAGYERSRPRRKPASLPAIPTRRAA